MLYTNNSTVSEKKQKYCRQKELVVQLSAETKFADENTFFL